MKEKNNSKFAIKLIMCLVYIIVIAVLFTCSYQMYEKKQEILPWKDIESVEDYTYITISKMSEKFAYYKDTNIGIHFVIEEQSSGQWHTYLIAIDEEDYNEYKNIIDYTYERREDKPLTVKAYGYPVITSKELRELAIKNITNFLPKENEVVITEENYEAYLTNSYLDTTKERKDTFNMMLFVLLLLMFLVIGLLIITILGRDKIVDKMDQKYDEEIDRAKLMFQRAKEKKKNKTTSK